ncbi:MAG: hypothetical protein A2W91_18120 [Bacteroidetes bacterium GWF2_38_335]|nr:MAG: hypothetical protein A2W91_18120 [Bacteroidetes bacterium GWF2_38_335]OFY80116.1 MAG: hypothetical protein A2281_12520 [Bacteroidetes bacterium RIFOXYA12_FULL_38_20]HBS88557.1 hypothetical protein [Bacteroidales bacterium]
MKSILTFVMAVSFFMNGNSQMWSNFECGMVGEVWDMIEYQGKLAVCGNFTQVDGLETQGFALWDGTDWTVTMNGFDLGLKMAINNDTLFTAAQDSSTVNIYYWNGTSQVQYARKYYEYCDELISLNNQLYLFSSLNQLQIIKPDTIQFHEYIDNSGPPIVYKNNFYFGGCFTSVDGVYSPHFVSYDGMEFHACDSGFSGGSASVQEMVVFNDTLFIAGSIHTEWGNPGNYLVKWDGEDFFPMNEEPDSNVYYLKSTDDMLFIAGKFDSIGNTYTNNFAMYDGTEYHSLGYLNYGIGDVIKYGDMVLMTGITVDSVHYGPIVQFNYSSSVKENSEITVQVKVFPNPCSDNIHFAIKNAPENEQYHLRIFNANGLLIKQVHDMNVIKTTISLQPFNPGIYFYEIYSDSGSTYRGKIIKSE